MNYIVTIFEQFHFWYHVFVLVKLASSPSRLVMCLVCHCVPVPIYIYCCNYQKTEFISDHQKILSLAVDASPGYHISGDEAKSELPMATHGSLREFDTGQDDWSTYLERVEEYFVANDTGDSQAKKHAILRVSCCGTATYQVFHARIRANHSLLQQMKVFATLVQSQKQHQNTTVPCAKCFCHQIA